MWERISKTKLRLYEEYAIFLSNLPNRDMSVRLNQLKLHIKDLKSKTFLKKIPKWLILNKTFF